MTPTATDTWNILRPQIEFLSKPFPSAAVDFAATHREEVAPHLIEALTQIASIPAIADVAHLRSVPAGRLEGPQILCAHGRPRVSERRKSGLGAG